jgi:hypothetical protein
MIAAINPLHLIKTVKLQAAVLLVAYGIIWSLLLYRYLPLTSLNFLLGALAFAVYNQ